MLFYKYGIDTGVLLVLFSAIGLFVYRKSSFFYENNTRSRVIKSLPIAAIIFLLLSVFYFDLYYKKASKKRSSAISMINERLSKYDKVLDTFSFSNLSSLNIDDTLYVPESRFLSPKPISRIRAKPLNIVILDSGQEYLLKKEIFIKKLGIDSVSVAEIQQRSNKREQIIKMLISNRKYDSVIIRQKEMLALMERKLDSIKHLFDNDQQLISAMALEQKQAKFISSMESASIDSVRNALNKVDKNLYRLRSLMNTLLLY